MGLLMIGHLLGDFYLQTDDMAKKKKRSFGYTLLHCGIYSVAMFAVLWFATKQTKVSLTGAILIGFLHLLVDGTKYLWGRNGKQEKCELAVFLVDQLIHVAILWGISHWYMKDIYIPGVNVGNAVLLCGKPAAIMVSLVFGLIPKTIEKADGNSAVSEGEKEGEKNKIGSWIGILEREIMLILGILGEYSAIGFVIAAKSLARHKQFDNPAFAEKYLIGTLLSSLIALLSIMLCEL